MKVNRVRQNVLPLVTAMIWGTAFVAQSVGAEYMGPFTFNTARAVIAFVFLLGLCGLRAAWRRSRGETPAPAGSRRDLILGGLCCGVALSVASFFQQKGLETTTPSNNAFLSAVYCVIVPFLAWALFRERPDRYNVAAALLCLAGVGLVSLTEKLTISVGDGFTLLGAVFCAANIIAVARLGRGCDVMLFTVVQLSAVALCAWVLALTTERSDFSALARPEVVWPMLYLCVMATAVCLVLMNVGLVWAEPAPAAVILSLEAVFGVILAVIFYGDPLTPRLLAGFALIFVGVLCSETKFSFLRKNA